MTHSSGDIDCSSDRLEPVTQRRSIACLGPVGRDLKPSRRLLSDRAS